jgi:hypothetical protein
MNALKKRKLSYKVYTRHILQIEGSVKYKIDIIITDKNGTPIYCIEVKDYADITMYTGIAGRNLIILETYPNIKFMNLTAQVASASEKQNIINKRLGLKDITYNDTLLAAKRDSKNNLFILDYRRSELVDSTNELISRLVKAL